MSNDSSSDVATNTQPDSKQVPWNPWVGASAAIFIFVAAQVVAGIAIYTFGATTGAYDEKIGNVLGYQMAFYGLTAVIIFGLIKLFLSLYKTNFKVLGFRKPKWTDPLYSLAALPVYLILFVIIVTITKALVPGLDINQTQDLGFNDDYNGGQLVFIALALVILPPLMEELTFRGLLFGSLKKGLPIIIAAIITSLFFAAGHLLQSSDGNLLYIAGIDTFTLSLVLIYLRQKSGGLWAPIGLHAIKNGIAFVALFLVGTS